MNVQDAIRAKEDTALYFAAQIPSVNGAGVRVGFGRIDANQSGQASSATSPIADSNVFTTQGSADVPSRALWIGSIPANTTSATLLSIFSPFGSVEFARVLNHKNCGFSTLERHGDV